MKQSQVSLAQKEGGSQEASMSMGSMMKDFEQQMHQSHDQVGNMEAFIQNKYSQIADLQKYLLEELQAIENSKTRNQRIEKELVTSTIPTLKQLRDAVLSIKLLLQPLSFLAANYVEAVAEKCKDYLKQKDQKIDKYEVELQRLREEVRFLRDQAAKSKGICKNVRTESNLEIVETQRHELQHHKKQQASIHRKQAEPEKVWLKITQSKSSLKTDRLTSDKNLSPCNASNKSHSKSPIKFNKYEQCYRNILENKKVNISYRCQKSPGLENLSPLKFPQGSNKIAKNQPLEVRDRKEYIKLKIEKIKSKAECRGEGGLRVRLK